MAFLSILVRINAHAGKRAQSAASVACPEGNSRQERIAEVFHHITGNSAYRASLAIVDDMAGMSTTAFLRNLYNDLGKQICRIRKPRPDMTALFPAVGHRRFRLIVNPLRCRIPGSRQLQPSLFEYEKMTPAAYRETALAEPGSKESAQK